jgi:bacteriorhodopsin
MPHFWVMFAYITGLTFLVVTAYYLQKINPENYAQVFLAVTIFKILACLAFMVLF